RSIGFPTANVAVVNETLPAAGVYACVFTAAGEAPRAAVANLGTRPTFGGQGQRLEAHVLDFAGDLYGRAVRVAFVARLRDERRFAGVEELSRQIAIDGARARGGLARGAEFRGGGGAVAADRDGRRARARSARGRAIVLRRRSHERADDG